MVPSTASHSNSLHCLNGSNWIAVGTPPEDLSRNAIGNQTNLNHHVACEVILKALQLQLENRWEVLKQHTLPCILGKDATITVVEIRPMEGVETSLRISHEDAKLHVDDESQWEGGRRA